MGLGLHVGVTTQFLWFLPMQYGTFIYIYIPSTINKVQVDIPYIALEVNHHKKKGGSF